MDRWRWLTAAEAGSNELQPRSHAFGPRQGRTITITPAIAITGHRTRIRTRAVTGPVRILDEPTRTHGR
jgi:hypothetical protein